MAFHWRWPLILFTLIVLSGESLSAASTKEQRAYAVAVSAFQTEMWGRAELQFAQFLRQYPKSTNAPEAVLLQAQAQFKQGKLAPAITLLTAHRAGSGRLADQYAYWIGEAQYQSGDLADAAATYASLARDYPESPLRLRAVVEAATAYARREDWRQHDALLDDTNGVFQRSVQMEPGNELVLDGQLSRENSKYQQHDFAGVAAVYDWLTNQWQSLSPMQQCQAVYLLYRARMKQGDFAAALESAVNLVQIAGSPKNTDWLATGWAGQGTALEQMDRVPEAIQAWRNNLTNSPLARKREAILRIAELKIGRGQLADAGAALTNFLAEFSESVSADVALLTAGELQLKNYAAQPGVSNDLQAAHSAFDRFIDTYTNSPFLGKAYLNRGWCEWLAGDTTNSLADFRAAAQRLPPSEDLAVARFKMGDALMAQMDYTNALANYRAVAVEFDNSPAAVSGLGDRALYQSLRASLALNDLASASQAVAQILKRFPESNLAPDSALLYGEGLAAARRPGAARAVFLDFETQYPDTPLRPQVELAIVRTYELEQNWPTALAGYQNWLQRYPTNAFRAQAFYSLALANARAGNQLNAFTLFNKFLAQFPTNAELAPLAQWWVADYCFGLGGTNYVTAERNYELVNQDFPTHDLANPALLMAGRAALGRGDYDGAINNYFAKLEADTNCPMDLRVQAVFAHGTALMQADSPETNNPLYNFQRATNVFSQICQLYPTNELGARAWGEIGECMLQLTNYDAATNAFAQVLNTNVPANISLRSQAQIGWGIALEKMAALATGTNQTVLLEAALNQYLDVFDTSYGKNLRAGEMADPFWVKKAGLQALPLMQTLGMANPDRFIDQMERLLPQLKDSLEKTRAARQPPTG